MVSPTTNLGPRQKPVLEDTVGPRWLNREKQSPSLCRELLHTLWNPTILMLMCSLGYDSQEMQESLIKSKFNEVTGTYVMLRWQAC